MTEAEIIEVMSGSLTPSIANGVHAKLASRRLLAALRDKGMEVVSVPKGKRKGIDIPCAIFKGPTGDCDETNCICD